MNRRLQQFLELEQLTPSRLADMLGIQRSSISHILSGRNKPGYDFLNKFILKFPQISAEWLISGKGKPYKEQNTPSTPENPVIFQEKDNSSPEIQDETQAEAEKEDFYPEFNDSRVYEEDEKKIIRCTIFYSDGSFEELYPPK